MAAERRSCAARTVLQFSKNGLAPQLTPLWELTVSAVEGFAAVNE